MKLYTCSNCKNLNTYSNMHICSCCGKVVCSSCAKMSGGICTNCYDSLNSSHYTNLNTKKSLIN